MKDQAKHEEKTAVKLNERLTVISHIPPVFLRVQLRFFYEGEGPTVQFPVGPTCRLLPALQ